MRQKIGTCHICGSNGKLTKEHVPPQRAFNKQKVVSVVGRKLIGIGPDDFPKGEIQQGGAHSYTLCSNCNNKTGHWYGNGFIDFCYQGMEYLYKSKGEPSLYYMYYLFPLQVIKQIVTMFFSVNTSAFSQKNPELVRFVLNKEQTYLPTKYRIYAYYNISNRCRYVGVTSLLKIENSMSSHTFCEINHPPFGYVLTLNSDPPDERLEDITFFANYPYNEFKVITINFPVLETHLPHPGDYRTRNEIPN